MIAQGGGILQVTQRTSEEARGGINLAPGAIGRLSEQLIVNDRGPGVHEKTEAKLEI